MNALKSTNIILPTAGSNLEPETKTEVAPRPSQIKSLRTRLQRGLVIGVALAATALCVAVSFSVHELESDLARIHANLMKPGFPTKP